MANQEEGPSIIKRIMRERERRNCQQGNPFRPTYSSGTAELRKRTAGTSRSEGCAGSERRRQKPYNNDATQSRAGTNKLAPGRGGRSA